MTFIDIHAHLQDKAFDSDRDIVVNNAQINEISVIINNATEFSDFQTLIGYAQKYPICKTALGLYPDTINEYTDEQIEQAYTFLYDNASKICAIGEIGLDYKWTKDEKLRKKQQHHFEKQIQIAQKLQKPIIIHSRNAEEDVIEILKKNNAQKVILHCFCGKKSLIIEGIKQNYYFSIPPKVVSDKQFQMLCELVPISQMFTETDSPYLHYKKGTRNEPKYIVNSITKIAEIKKLDSKETRYILYQNYIRLFL